MTDSNATSSTRQYDTLVSPLESADEPAWLRNAAPQERRQLFENQRSGRLARREATQAFVALPSLYHHHRAILTHSDAADITPQTLLALHQQQPLNTDYIDNLTGTLDSSTLRSAKEHAYLATLREEFTRATLRGTLGKEGRTLLEWIIGAFHTGSPEFADQGPYLGTGVAVCAALQLHTDTVLADIILLGPDDDDTPCVAFVPGHPQHPLKQYPTRKHFFTSLRRDLLDSEFQQYFSRFITLPHQQRVLASWAGRQAVLDLPMAAKPLEQTLRSYAHTQMAARLLADARYLIPLDAPSAKALQALRPSYATLLQEHLLLGAGVGIGPGEEDEGRAPSDWLAPFRAVKLQDASGYRRWLPDLSDYRLSSANSPMGEPDAQGIYTAGEHKAIAINQAFYRIEKTANGRWRLLHPSATSVYLPALRHNGAGAWHHHLEQPQYWDRLALLRRLGPLSAGFTDERLLELGRVSGVSNAELRRVYQLDKPVPALLLHVLQRARIQNEVSQIMALIAKGMPVPEGYQVPQLDAFYEAVAIRNGQQPRPHSRRVTRSGDSTPTPLPCDGNCTPPSLDLYLQWFARLSRAIVTHRYELAQLDTDHAVQELQRRYPLMPLSVAQRMLDFNQGSVRALLASTSARLPLEVAEHAQALEHDARLTSALEGFTVVSSINQDTFILAVRLLEHCDGWQAGTALLLRRGDRFGVPLAELGETDVDTTSVYLDDEEGWSTSTSTQVVLAQDMTEYGFYRALLFALSERQRALLGFGLNEPERLHQRLREMALARPTRARMLLGMPVRRTWLTPPLIDTVQRPPASAEDDVFNREPSQRRLARLITHQSLQIPVMSAERYINRLLMQNQPITARIEQLELERHQLERALDAWIAQGSDETVRGHRTAATPQLVYGWEAHIGEYEPSLHFDNRHLGGLPPLPVTLTAVNSLRIMDITQLQNLPTMLQHLPNLQRLELINLPLTELPDALLNLRQLRALNLSRTALSPASLARLGTMGNLQTLILNDMTLRPYNWSARDMTRVTASGSLQTLTMQGSQTSFGPGVFAVLGRLANLMTLNLGENDIVLSAEDVTDLGNLQQLRSLDLSNNPLSRMPNLSNLQDLEEVDLSRLQGPISQWPEGLERLPRVVSADLRHVPITQVPEGAGRTRGLYMSTANLSETQRERFEAEMLAVGNDVYDDDAEYDSGSQGSSEDEGPQVRDQNALRDAPRLFEGMSSDDRAQAAQLLVPGESSIAEFFSLLLRVDVSAPAQRPEANMRARIQALVRGAFTADLRQALHEQARQAISCVDRDAVVFSQMENLLHADQALAKADDAAAGGELIALATSHWRVHRLKEHVTANITTWRLAGHSIDYSEIELYFRIALATRLGLRDQPTSQVFTSYTSWVTQDMLDTAYSAVLAPQAELLPDYLNEQPYWQRFLDSAHADRIGAINQWRDRLGEYLDAVSGDDELPPQLSEMEREHLRQVLIGSGQLGRLDPLPSVLSLNSNQYRAAYEALAKRVAQARLDLTHALLEPQPGPSSRH